MKKILILLMMVAMVSFLFAGCFLEPDEPVDPDEPVVEICPVVTVTSEVEVGGKKYIGKGEQTITVTFAVPTEPVSVYVGDDLKNYGFVPGYEVVMYPNDDKTVYIGEFVFGERPAGDGSTDIFFNPDCSEAYIYVETCETCDYCKYPYTVDKVAPYASIEITSKLVCPNEYSIKFDSAWVGETTENGGCVPPGGCCGDECSEFASWTIGIYDMAFDHELFDCCAKLLYSGEGTACPILWETDCREVWGNTYLIIELEDVVGNSKRYYAAIITPFSFSKWTLLADGSWDKLSDEGFPAIIGDECP